MKLFAIILMLSQTVISITIRANIIDSIRTKKDVENFVNVNFPEFESKFWVDSEIYSNADSSILIPVSYNGWDKTDIDNNGFTDVLINGIDRIYTLKLIILAINDTTFKKVSIPEHMDSHIPYVFADTVDGISAIIVMRHIDLFSDSIVYDTLVYKFESIVNYSKHHSSYNIKELTLCTEILGMDGEDYSVYVNFESNVGQVSFSRWGKHFSVSNIDTTTINKIYNILNYMNFTEFNDRYDLRWSCLSTTSLEIKYDQERQKIIYDYGQWGTYSLRAIYYMLMASAQ